MLSASARQVVHCENSLAVGWQTRNLHRWADYSRGRIQGYKLSPRKHAAQAIVIKWQSLDPSAIHNFNVKAEHWNSKLNNELDVKKDKNRKNAAFCFGKRLLLYGYGVDARHSCFLNCSLEMNGCGNHAHTALYIYTYSFHCMSEFFFSLALIPHVSRHRSSLH